MADFTNDERLKGCPLCEGHSHIAEVVRTYVPSAYFAACDDPECRMFESPGVAHYRDSVDEAIEAWNAMPRWYEMAGLLRGWMDAPCTSCDPFDDHFECDYFDGSECTLRSRAREMEVG